MTNEYSADIPKGLNVPKQVRLDSITSIQNENTLKNLGSGNNLAFKYYEGLKVYCKDEKKEYIWRQVVGSETGLLTTHFVYPTYPSIDGIDYSGKSFNFFLVTNNGTPANGSETKINAGTNTTVTGLGTIASPYVINSTDTVANGSETKINEGDNINITGNGTQLTPYIINADLTDLGIVKTVNNEVISPTQSLSIINNEPTGKVLVTKEYVQSIIPNTPDGSETKINSGSNIVVTGTGTTLDPYTISSSIEINTTYINQGDNIEITGNGAIDNPYIINSTGVQSVTGNIVDNTDPLNPIVTSPTLKTINGESIIGTGDIEIDNLQKVITYPTDFAGTNYNITNSDYNYVIFINNGTVDVSITLDASINIPNFSVGFIQEGSGTVTHLVSGVSLINTTGYKIKGYGQQTFIEKKLNTNVYYLLGNTKV
mgnify:CR=1 FL=1